MIEHPGDCFLRVGLAQCWVIRNSYLYSISLCTLGLYINTGTTTVVCVCVCVCVCHHRRFLHTPLCREWVRTYFKELRLVHPANTPFASPGSTVATSRRSKANTVTRCSTPRKCLNEVRYQFTRLRMLPTAHAMKAPLPTGGRKTTEVSDVQSAKACSPILSNDPGSVRDVRPVHRTKASAPILFKESGSVRDVSPVH